MREVEYKTMDQIQADIIKKIMDELSSPVSITRCYETLFGRTIPREANKDGIFEIWR
jgi:hypothetical protein|tara:strand:+ start:405 stop:575 length:171 start_codon:yes stop_codon:yes gene_type:complete